MNIAVSTQINTEIFLKTQKLLRLPSVSSIPTTPPLCVISSYYTVLLSAYTPVGSTRLSNCPKMNSSRDEQRRG